MRHRVNKRAFGRKPQARMALMRGLATSLVENERITTTVVKAKELRKVVEPLVTLAKRGDLHARRQAAGVLYKSEAVKKLFSELAERFKTRAGGYTRIFRKGFRRGDGAETAIIEFIPDENKPKKDKAPVKAAGDEKAPEAKKPAKKPAAAKKAPANKEAPKKAKKKA